MELVFQTKPMRYLSHILHESRSQEENTEVIVPDSSPDILRIAYSSAAVILRAKECRNGCVMLSGGVRADAICVPEGESAPQTLEAYLPFNLRVEHPTITERTQTIANLFIRQIDARLVHSRKVMFHVEIGCTIDGYEPTEQTICSIQEVPTELQLQQQTYPVLLPMETEEKKFLFSDEVELPQGKPFIATVCSYKTIPNVTDSKVVGNKIVFKGTIQLKMLYLSGDGSLNTWEESFPFSQYCDLAGEHNEAPHDVQIVVSSAELEPDTAGEGRKMQLNVEFTAQAVIYSTTSIEVITDAYAVGGNLEAEWKEYTFDCRLDCQTPRDTLHTPVEIDGVEIVTCGTYADFPYLERTEDGIRVKTPIVCKLLYWDTEGKLQGVSTRTEAMCETALCENAHCTAVVQFIESFAQLHAAGAEIQTQLEFAFLCHAVQQMRTLCGGSIQLDTQKRRPGVILRFCREDEAIWDVAKQYATTVEAVCEANQLEEEMPHPDRLLLIPMC